MTPDNTPDPTCPLCRRPLGSRAERHHLIPRLKGGRDTVRLHPICHRKIHSLFSEAELARHRGSLDPVLAHPDMQAFIRWLDGKPPDFHRSTKSRRN